MTGELILIVVAYLLGSIPFGVILTKVYGGKDITKEGSGNIGATNVGRVVGKKAGIITLLLDALKGALPVIIAMTMENQASWLVPVVALAAFLGHLYPVFNGFKGGKGVATALGVFVVINPLSTLLAALAFGLVFGLWRYVSLGSVLAAFVLPGFMGMLGASPTAIAVSIVIAGMVIYRHKDNIGRLLRGEESRLGEKKGEPEEAAPEESRDESV